MSFTLLLKNLIQPLWVVAPAKGAHQEVVAITPNDR